MFKGYLTDIVAAAIIKVIHHFTDDTSLKELTFRLKISDIIIEGKKEVIPEVHWLGKAKDSIV